MIFAWFFLQRIIKPTIDASKLVLWGGRGGWSSFAATLRFEKRAMRLHCARCPTWVTWLMLFRRLKTDLVLTTLDDLQDVKQYILKTNVPFGTWEAEITSIWVRCQSELSWGCGLMEWGIGVPGMAGFDGADCKSSTRSVRECTHPIVQASNLLLSDFKK